MGKSLPPENEQQNFATEQLTSRSLNTWTSSCCPRISKLSPFAFNFPACIGFRKVSPGRSFKIEIIVKKNYVKHEKQGLTTYQTPGYFVPRAFPWKTSSRLPISNGKALETRLNRRKRVQKQSQRIRNVFDQFWGVRKFVKILLIIWRSYLGFTFNSNRLLISPFERCSSTDVNISLDKIAMRASICRVSPKFSSNGNGAWERMACASWLRSRNMQKVNCWESNVQDLSAQSHWQKTWKICYI